MNLRGALFNEVSQRASKEKEILWRVGFMVEFRIMHLCFMFCVLCYA